MPVQSTSIGKSVKMPVLERKKAEELQNYYSSIWGSSLNLSCVVSGALSHFALRAFSLK